LSYWLEVILAEGVDDEGFVAGATGVIGTQLVPRLVEAGREVHGMTRSESKQAMLRGLGAVPVVADALDPDQVAEAVGSARRAAAASATSATGCQSR
jgi:nucleoside-diphosphate-sugar epimerase